VFQLLQRETGYVRIDVPSVAVVVALSQAGDYLWFDYCVVLVQDLHDPALGLR
jgi:hypothetical protein